MFGDVAFGRYRLSPYVKYNTTTPSIVHYAPFKGHIMFSCSIWYMYIICWWQLPNKQLLTVIRHGIEWRWVYRSIAWKNLKNSNSPSNLNHQASTGTLWQHAQTIIAPSFQSVCAINTHKLDSISVSAKTKTEGSTLGGGDQLRWKQGLPFLPRTGRGFLYIYIYVWEHYDNTLWSSQYTLCNRCVLEPPMNSWTAFQLKPNLRGPFMGKNDQLRRNQGRPLLLMAGRSLLYVWEQSDIFLRSSQ